MKLRTIGELNEKIWYRFIKVIYLCIFLLVIVIFNVVIFNDDVVGLKNINRNKTKIICNYKDKRTFTPNEKKIDLDMDDFKNGVFDYKNFFEGYYNYKVSDILEACYDKDTGDIFATQRWYELKLNEKSEKNEGISGSEMQEVLSIEKTIGNSQKAKFLDYSVQLFSIKPVFTYLTFFKYFILGNMGILIAFELFRRVFYYVILGKIIPQKKNESHNLS